MFRRKPSMTLKYNNYTGLTKLRLIVLHPVCKHSSHSLTGFETEYHRESCGFENALNFCTE